MFEEKKTAAENLNQLNSIYNEFKDTLYDIQPAMDALSDTNGIKLTVKAIKQYYIEQLNNAKAAYEQIAQKNIQKQVTTYNAEAQAYIKEIQEKRILELKDRGPIQRANNSVNNSKRKARTKPTSNRSTKQKYKI